jgi:quercetin dioxygenase-like cupin family protein
MSDSASHLRMTGDIHVSVQRWVVPSARFPDALRTRVLGRKNVRLASPPSRSTFDPPSLDVGQLAFSWEVLMSLRTSMVAAIAIVAALHTSSAQAQAGAKLTWGPVPPVLPAGAKMAVVSGDPGKAAPFVIQLDMPAGYVVPPHSHPTDENITVKSGRFGYAMADKIDAKQTKYLKPGQSVSLKANMNHYAQAKGHTLVQLSSMGPFSIKYVNPADDPSKMKP